MIYLLALVIWLAWLAFGSWIIQVNVNTIIQTGYVPDAWPILWILLVLGVTLGSASTVKS